MAKETFTGPMLVLGGLAGNTRLPAAGSGGVGQGPVEYSDEIGPSVFWSGIVIPARGSKDKTGPGTIAGVFGAFPIKTVNIALQAGGAGAPLTTAGPATAGAALPILTTYAAGRAPVPVIVGGVPGTGIVMDAGLDTATFATAGTATLSVVANAWRYQVGQWVGLLNGGLSGACQFSQITAINPSTGALTVNPAPAANGTGQLTLTNRFNPNLYGYSPPTGVSASKAAGSARIVIPEIATSRGIGITGVAGGTGGVFLVQGTDTFDALQSELVTVGAGAVTGWSRKTYDTFISATPQFTDASHNYTVVASDLIGMPMSILSANSLYSVSLGGTALALSTGFTVQPADLTNPATTATMDTRGAIQLTANGPLAAPSAPGTLNGTNVLTVFQVLDPLQVALASPVNPGPLMGVHPA